MLDKLPETVKERMVGLIHLPGVQVFVCLPVSVFLSVSVRLSVHIKRTQTMNNTNLLTIIQSIHMACRVAEVALHGNQHSPLAYILMGKVPFIPFQWWILLWNLLYLLLRHNYRRGVAASVCRHIFVTYSLRSVPMFLLTSVLNLKHSSWAL